MTMTLLKSLGHIFGWPRVCLGSTYLAGIPQKWYCVPSSAAQGTWCWSVYPSDANFDHQSRQTLRCPRDPHLLVFIPCVTPPPLKCGQNLWLASNHQNTAKVTGCFTSMWLCYLRYSFHPAEPPSPLLAMRKPVAQVGEFTQRGTAGSI